MSGAQTGMSGYAYTEDQLVEQPAIGLFAELGWTTVSALEETFGATGTLLRETKGEVVLVSQLRAALASRSWASTGC
jgi:type I restriction enzyme R subunit